MISDAVSSCVKDAKCMASTLVPASRRSARRRVGKGIRSAGFGGGRFTVATGTCVGLGLPTGLVSC
jgi:hypothetical protein